jgi:hypothetical protein
MKLSDEDVKRFTEGKTLRYITKKFVRENIPNYKSYRQKKTVSEFISQIEIIPGNYTPEEFISMFSDQIKDKINLITVAIYSEEIECFSDLEVDEEDDDIVERLQKQLKDYIRSAEIREKEYQEYLRLKKQFGEA